jgi:hypothetical protein
MLPAIAAAAAKVAGPLVGGIMNSNDIQQGMADYRTDVNRGTSVLQGGINSANAAYSPYTGAGASGVAGEQLAIQNRQQAAQPTLSNVDPSQALSYLDPSAAYSTDQSNKAIQAQALASGGAGGGMMKALANNASDRAMTNYNSAFGQMLGAANTNFGQQQQQYVNQTGYDQSQIQNYAGLAGQGLQAVSGNQGLNANYNAGINGNFGDIAANQQSGWNALGKNAKDTATDLGNNISGGISNIWGK